MVRSGGARKREHRDAAPGARRTETEVRLERPEASASAAGSVEQALRAELELARKDAELARKDAALKDAESREELARKDAELLREKLARKEAERKWLPTIKPTLCVCASKKRAGIALCL